MTIIEAKFLALRLLRSHGLDDWKVKINKRRSTLGLCCINSRTIELSQPIVEVNREKEVREIILHEIAHAISKRVRHDEVWKKTARMVGCREVGARIDVEHPKSGRWRYSCPACGMVVGRVRRAKGRLSCRRCGGARFDERFVMREEEVRA